MFQENAIVRFRPERPIYLSRENTTYKTQVEVIHAVEQLRAKGWLCAYAEKVRPLHMSFNDEREFQEFKKTAKALGIVLKSPVIKPEEIEELDQKELEGQKMVEAEANSTYEDPDGKIHIE